jgi:hypothetical protein
MQYKYHIQGSVAELKAASEFVSHGFFVYFPITSSAPFDFIAAKDSNLYRVQVRSSSRKLKSGVYKFDLRSSNPLYYKNFDPSSCDILVCYLCQENVICYVKSAEVLNATGINFKHALGKSNQYRQWIITDFADFDRLGI